MANNYILSSSFMDIPAEQMGAAELAAKQAMMRLEDGTTGDEDTDMYGYCCVHVEFEPSGIWFSHGDDCINLDHLEYIVMAVQDAIKSDEPFACEWAYTCDKPRIDEFGGGAMVVQRGHKTQYMSTASFMHKILNKRKRINKKSAEQG